MIAETSELVAGGRHGLFILSESSEDWQPLLDECERRGLSALLSTQADELAEMSRLGVPHVSVVAANRLADAVGIAGRSACGSLCLLSPTLPEEPALHAVIRRLRLPRLLLGGACETDARAVRHFEAASAGPIAMRFLHAPGRGANLLTEPKGLVAEAICLFALRHSITLDPRQPVTGFAA